ncbi:MAG: hypothetical protein CENE_01454 [Candidatus Celerinatantimonas neptuna]|nr:MAG: hypothetical protein CENE_01454 [Candidatus Celerinatantimonas neptuna]
MTMLPHQQVFLDEYLDLLSKDERDAIPQVIAEYFCDDEYHANECARLIRHDVKKASCSLKAAYEQGQDPLPQVGQLTVVLNWQQDPICIVQLKSVTFCPFNQVLPEFARAEGEGDGSYAWWKQAHMRFFTDFAKEIGVTFDESSELVLEKFERVYPL